MAKSVFLVGLDPYQIDTSDPAVATAVADAGFGRLTAVDIQKQLEEDDAALNKLGYDAKLFLCCGNRFA
ncbi:hypothetical protein [Burkholderia cenocepacia]|uniref:hypothetical protein n=1 Tax=Burkholderia cenocepacia TaxID=95486 RepID=UPI000847C740|nr:hypothetical protein [Burkholderia cenocepacia]